MSLMPAAISESKRFFFLKKKNQKNF